MTFVKRTLALSTALLLISAPAAFSADNSTTPNGGPGTQMRGGADKTGLESGRSTSTDSTGGSAGSDLQNNDVQNNRGPAQTGGLGGSHKGP